MGSLPAAAKTAVPSLADAATCSSNNFRSSGVGCAVELRLSETAARRAVEAAAWHRVIARRKSPGAIRPVSSTVARTETNLPWGCTPTVPHPFRAPTAAMAMYVPWSSPGRGAGSPWALLTVVRSTIGPAGSSAGVSGVIATPVSTMQITLRSAASSSARRCSTQS